MISTREQSFSSQASQSTRLNPLFQLILIILSIPVVIFALTRGLSTTRAKDPMPDLTLLTPEYLKELGGYPTTLKVGLYIDKFETFDIIKNDFVFTGFIWFQYNPGAVSLDTLSKFNFESGKILDQSEADVRQINGQLVVRYTIRVQLKSPLIYTQFPFDNHRIFIILDNKFVSPSEFLFSASTRNFVVDTQAQGWNLQDIHTITGFKKAELDHYDTNLNMNYPRVVFQMDYAKSGMRNIFVIYIPLLILFLISALGLSLPAQKSIKLTSIGIITTILYRFIIESIAPQTEYFTYADIMFFLFLGASLLIFLINIFDIVSTKITPEIKKLTLFFIFTLIDVATLFIFWN